MRQIKKQRYMIRRMRSRITNFSKVPIGCSLFCPCRYTMLRQARIYPLPILRKHRLLCPSATERDGRKRRQLAKAAKGGGYARDPCRCAFFRGFSRLYW